MKVMAIVLKLIRIESELNTKTAHNFLGAKIQLKPYWLWRSPQDYGAHCYWKTGHASLQRRVLRHKKPEPLW